MARGDRREKFKLWNPESAPSSCFAVATSHQQTRWLPDRFLQILRLGESLTLQRGSAREQWGRYRSGSWCLWRCCVWMSWWLEREEQLTASVFRMEGCLSFMQTNLIWDFSDTTTIALEMWLVQPTHTRWYTNRVCCNNIPTWPLFLFICHKELPKIHPNCHRTSQFDYIFNTRNAKTSHIFKSHIQSHHSCFPHAFLLASWLFLLVVSVRIQDLTSHLVKNGFSHGQWALMGARNHVSGASFTTFFCTCRPPAQNPDCAVSRALHSLSIWGRIK